MKVSGQSSKAQNRELFEWFSMIHQGQIKLPRFQRYESWDRGRIISLLEVVINNLPLGVTLVLQVGDEEKFESRFLSGAERSGDSRPIEHLLDGQQRLTALWRSMYEDYEHETYFIYVPEFEEYYEKPWNDEIQVYCRTRYYKEDRRYPLWPDKPDETLRRGMIPVWLFRPGDISSKIDSWINNALAVYKEESNVEIFYQKKERVKDCIQLFREVVAHFNLPYLSLPAKTPKEVALQVFINMNTNSKPLSLYDIIVAEVESDTGQSLHDMIDEINTNYPNVKEYGPDHTPEAIVLNVAALLQSKTPSQRGQLEMSKKQMVKDWDRIVSSLDKMSTFLEGQRIYDRERLPTNAILAVIAALYTQIPNYGDERGKAERLLRKYIWSSFFNDRYENSASSRAYSDYQALSKVLEGNGQEEEVPALDREEHPIATVEEIMEAGWPKRQEILARAILAVSLYSGAVDFSDEQQISRTNLTNREYHHLFPDALLKETDHESYKALNCALITWKTNRTIGSKSPLQYIKERAEWSSDEIVEQRLKSHLIPIKELATGGYEGLNTVERVEKKMDDYTRFLEMRAQLVHFATTRLTEGEITSAEETFSAVHSI